MTCIVGIAKDGKVYMGCDSITSNGYTREITKRSKVFRVGEFLIGTCGSIRMANILQYHLAVRPLEENEDIDRYMVIAFIEAVRECLKSKGVASINSNVETSGDFLCGFRGKLYQCAADFQVDSYVGDTASCGCGSDYALGAMLALPDLPPQDRIRRALEVSAELCALVSAPFHIEVL